jgi:serine acetyltransferase
MCQVKYFIKDINVMVRKKKLRLLIIWINRAFVGIFLYRLERSLYLLFPKIYFILRIPFLPIIYLLQVYSNLDIPYQADIKGGLKVLHPSVGVVISKYAIIGENLTLTGGNIIGIRKKIEDVELIIGDNCNLGANAVILGPVKIGNNIKIGASACVVKNFIDNDLSLVGVTAKII